MCSESYILKFCGLFVCLYVTVCLSFCSNSAVKGAPISTNLKVIILRSLIKYKEKLDDKAWYMLLEIGRPVYCQHPQREREARKTCYSYLLKNNSVGFTSSRISISSYVHRYSICKWGKNTLFCIEVTRISNPSFTSCERQEAHNFMGRVDPNLVTAWHDM